MLWPIIAGDDGEGRFRSTTPTMRDVQFVCLRTQIEQVPRLIKLRRVGQLLSISPDENIVLNLREQEETAESKKLAIV